MWLVFVYLSLFLIMYLLLHILNSTCLRHLAINLCYLPAIANIIVFIKEKHHERDLVCSVHQGYMKA